MSINKNDCLDCGNCIFNMRKYKFICDIGNEIKYDSSGIVEILDEDCEDFKYED